MENGKPETRAELKAVMLFKRRFPGQWEYRKENNLFGGYFAEWVDRMSYPDPTHWMDSETLTIYREILKELTK